MREDSFVAAVLRWALDSLEGLGNRRMLGCLGWAGKDADILQSSVLWLSSMKNRRINSECQHSSVGTEVQEELFLRFQINEICFTSAALCGDVESWSVGFQSCVKCDFSNGHFWGTTWTFVSNAGYGKSNLTFLWRLKMAWVPRTFFPALLDITVVSWRQQEAKHHTAACLLPIKWGGGMNRKSKREKTHGSR